MTLIYQLGVVTFFLSRETFVMQLYQSYYVFFDVEVKPDQKSEELHFPSVIFQLYSGAHLIWRIYFFIIPCVLIFAASNE